jgi:hypothetical protein
MLRGELAGARATTLRGSGACPLRAAARQQLRSRRRDSSVTTSAAQEGARRAN